MREVTLEEAVRTALAEPAVLPVFLSIVERLDAPVPSRTDECAFAVNLLFSDPSLGLRVLSLANQKQPVETLSSAVRQVGLEGVRGFARASVVSSGFGSLARSDRAVERVLQYALCIRSLITSLYREYKGGGLLNLDRVGMFGRAATLMHFIMAIKEPRLCASVVSRVKLSEAGFDENLKTLSGLGAFEWSRLALEPLSLPHYLDATLELACTQPRATRGASDEELMATALLDAHTIAETLEFGTRHRLADQLPQLAARSGVAIERYRQCLSELPSSFYEQTKQLGLPSLNLPDYVVSYGKGRGGGTFRTATLQLSDVLKEQLDEIRVDMRATRSVRLTTLSAMELLAWGMGFEEVTFYQTNSFRTELSEAFRLGPMTAKQVMPYSLERPANDANPDMVAFTTGRVVVSEAAVRGYPHSFEVYIPVGFQANAVGIIHAFRRDRPALSFQGDLNALQDLSDILDEAVRLESSM